jgi:hypothetical protein
MQEIVSIDRSDGGQDVRLGGIGIGHILPHDGGWYAHPAGDQPVSWHTAEYAAVCAVVHAHTGGGYILAPTLIGFWAEMDEPPAATTTGGGS